MIKYVWKCIFTPRLIKLYGFGPVEKLYEPTALENLGDTVIQSLYLIWKLGVYTTPLLVIFLTRRGYFEPEGFVTLTKFITLLGGVIVSSYLIRGIGRASNPVYTKFIAALDNAQTGLTSATKRDLSLYDFDFFAWPVEFRWSDVAKLEKTASRSFIDKPESLRNIMQLGATLPCQIISYLAIHSFGIKLLYPGTLTLLQNMISHNLLQGRSKLIEVNGGVRYKLEAKDGNEIDTMFVDKRASSGNGTTLVICSEGNAGFYEIGIMGTPIAAGYSVLGWNHPGFGGSTGTPYPSQELNAMDAVMLFAIHRLGFQVENIVLYGWSIGGYSTSWAAMNYPEVKAMILDASFDDIMPLALNYMPSWSESIIRLAVRQYVNLNNIKQMSKYSGPVLLIRRSQDEVICTETGNQSSNRGNFLLLKLLKFRYPLVMGEKQQTILLDYLGLSLATAQDDFLKKYDADETCNRLLESHLRTNNDFSELGAGLNDDEKTKLTLYLATKYMKDYKSTHCTPLPMDMFQMPWEPIEETKRSVTLNSMESKG
ncbi:PREDICTED: protein ABHD16A [Nicrophorus vespilloides]|uniref:Protein ABHD16A n=1 Tax=Nicrophorus vespilloides TaxID=110193 RepID=A0ABM1N0Z5_NICVS|nr:PREDICTED: protein ABHD16A [Nicrophorus vespilloides]